MIRNRSEFALSSHAFESVDRDSIAEDSIRRPKSFSYRKLNGEFSNDEANVDSATSAPNSSQKPIVGPKVEVYGFVSWTASFVACALFMAWAYLPDHILHKFDVYYYPNRYWAFAVPVYAIVAISFGIVMYVVGNLRDNEPLNSLSTIVDEFALPPPPNMGVCEVPPIYDIPIATVNDAMFGHARRQRRSTRRSHSATTTAPSQR